MSNQISRGNIETGDGRATDGQLLQKFVDRNDNEAFAALVHRYSELVMGLCRRTLRDEHCAEDAFQATFLVLARKAARIRKHASLAGWLYAVAYRTARRAQTDRRNRREQALLNEMKDPDDLFAGVASRHEQLLLDEEIQQLAAKYREPLVLRYLVGKSNREVASELGIPLGVVEGRLKRAKDKLRQRLARRGVSAACAIAAVAASAGEATAAESLVVATVDAAAAIGAGTEIPSGFSEGAIHLCERELMMRTSTLAATTASVSVIALAIAGFALTQGDGLGQATARAAEPPLTVSPAQLQNDDAVVFTSAAPQQAKPDATESPLTGAEKIEAALEERGDFVHNDVPLSEVMDEIAQKHHINVVIDHRSLDDVGLGADTPVTANLTDLPLDSRLTLMLRELDLTWTIDEGVLLVTTPEESENRLITRIYEVGDLIKFQDKEGEEWQDYDQLIEVITSTIQPDSWDEVGGAGAIEPSPFGNAEMLTIAQTYQIHRRIEKYLKTLREFTKSRVGDGLPVREKPPKGQMGGMGGMGGGMGGFGGGSGMGGGGASGATGGLGGGAPQSGKDN